MTVEIKPLDGECPPHYGSAIGGITRYDKVSFHVDAEHTKIFSYKLPGNTCEVRNFPGSQPDLKASETPRGCTKDCGLCNRRVTMRSTPKPQSQPETLPSPLDQSPPAPQESTVDDAIPEPHLATSE